MGSPQMPRPTDETKALFTSVVPAHPYVTERPMFGQRAAFVHGNMFMGIHGDQLLLRLPEPDRETVIAKGGATVEPMAGRPMREYVALPTDWHTRPTVLREWVGRSLRFVQAMPPTAPKTT
jgi:TfoX/Sxy family transcriptional regulator of competence genes